MILTGGSTVALVGDSNVQRGQAKYAAALRAVGYPDSAQYVYGCGGKRILDRDACGRTLADNVAEARARLGTVDIWVIALGTNDVNGNGITTSTLAARVTQAFDTIDPDPAAPPARVLWVGLGFKAKADARVTKYASTLASSVAAEGGALLDWQGFVHDPAIEDPALWITTDGVHHTPYGYAVKATWLAGQVAR